MEPPNLYPVKLYVYDLSKGLARRLSPIMLGEGAGVRWEGRQEPRWRVPAGLGGKSWTMTPGRGRVQRMEDRPNGEGMGVDLTFLSLAFPSSRESWEKG
jgi:hypothetical protein